MIKSALFKKITVVVGILFIIAAYFIALKPEPFLKFGYPGVFVFNLVGPGFFLIPFLSRYLNIWLLSFVSALGMALNDCISWYAGRNADVFLPHSPKITRLKDSIKKYGVFALFFWSLIPFPYDAVGLIAGYFHLPFLSFLIPTFLGRFIRFVLVGHGVVAFFGKV